MSTVGSRKAASGVHRQRFVIAHALYLCPAALSKFPEREGASSYAGTGSGEPLGTAPLHAYRPRSRMDYYA